MLPGYNRVGRIGEFFGDLRPSALRRDPYLSAGQ
jgi:hypothetical protein